MAIFDLWRWWRLRLAGTASKSARPPLPAPAFFRAIWPQKRCMVHACDRKELLMRVQRVVLALVLSSGAWGSAAEPEKPAADVSFFKDVLPILRAKNCTGCHQPAKQGGE